MTVNDIILTNYIIVYNKILLLIMVRVMIIYNCNLIYNIGGFCIFRGSNIGVLINILKKELISRFYVDGNCCILVVRLRILNFRVLII